jgi:hypothetical protein
VQRGQAATWLVSTWAQNGNVPDAVIKLAASPAGQSPVFSFGCGSQDGTTSCDLGGVFSGSAARQVQASLTVPAAATSVTSVKLTTSLTAANLVKTPAVAVSVSVTAAPSPSATSSTSSPASSSPGTSTASPSSATSPLPVGSLPTIGGGTSTTLSPGGNAANLFPTVNPAAVPTPLPNTGGNTEVAKGVANNQAMPIGTPVIDAQLAGLGALGVAFMLAVTRLSVRRRPSQAAKEAAAEKLVSADDK